MVKTAESRAEWNSRRERYFMRSKQKRVEPRFHDFYRGWV
jgi:hypothetical protein